MTLLSEVAEIHDCEHKTAPITPGGGYFAVGTPAMRGNSINLNEAREIDEETYRAWTRRSTPRAGDILFAREAPVGPVVRIPPSQNVAPGQRTVLLQPDSAKVDASFLYYLLASPSMQANIAEKSAGSTVHHLNVADVRALPLGDLPSLWEQRTIGEVLGALDDKIAANRRLADGADALLKALFERDRSTAAGPQPLGNLLTLHYGKSLPVSARAGGVVPVVGSGGVVGTHSDALVSHATVVVGRKGSVGTCYWMPDGCFPIDTTFWVESRGVPLIWLFYLLRSINFAEMNSDSAVPGLNRNRAYSEQVHVPTPVALERFDGVARSLRARMDMVEKEIRILAATRDELLPLLMSGRVRVRDVEALVEGVV